MFSGLFNVRVTPTGAIVLPGMLMDDLPEALARESWFLVKGFDGALALYPTSRWREVQERVQSLSKENRFYLKFSRQFNSGAYTTKVSEGGRLRIVGNLLSWSRIGSEALVVGMIDYIELWAPDRYEAYMTYHGRSYEKVAEALFGGGGPDESGEEEAAVRQDIQELKDKRILVDPSERTGVRIKDGVFLCHSSADKELVRKVATDLSQYGVSVWLDEWELLPGDSLLDKIQDGIDRAGWFLIFLSPNSVNSEWVRSELKQALVAELEARRVIVVPILLDNCDIPGFLRDKLYVDMREKAGYLDAFDRLVTRFDQGLPKPSI